MKTNSFSYSKYSKHLGLFYAALVLFIFIPIPFYSEFIFDHHIREKSALILQGIGLAALIFYVWIDYDNQKLFRKIEVDSESIKSLGENDEVDILWNDIERFDKLVSGDKETLSALGTKGVRILANNGDKIVIYESINDYDVLLNIINSRKS